MSSARHGAERKRKKKERRDHQTNTGKKTKGATKKEQRRKRAQGNGDHGRKDREGEIGHKATPSRRTTMTNPEEPKMHTPN